MNIYADKNLINIDHLKKKKNDFFSLYIAQERSDNYSKIRPVVAFFDNWSKHVEQLAFLCRPVFSSNWTLTSKPRLNFKCSKKIFPFFNAFLLRL